MSERAWKTACGATPCQVCGKADWCQQRSDGALICRRHEGPEGEHRIDKNGAEFRYFAPTSNGSCPSNQEAHRRDGKPCASAAVCHEVYSALLSRLSLSEVHKANMIARGLSNDAIRDHGYRSLPPSGRHEFARHIVDQFGEETCAGIPGLYRKATAGGGWSVAGAAGMLIPVRNSLGQIVALKVRSDGKEGAPRYTFLSSKKHGGASARMRIHVPRGVDLQAAGALRITEGELKADIATHLSGVRTISAPGVGMWKMAAQVAKELRPSKVLLAFDADHRTNPNVGRALHDLYYSLVEAGLEVAVEVWSAELGKGIDDVLLSSPEAVVTLDGKDARAHVDHYARPLVDSMDSMDSKPSTSSSSTERVCQTRSLISAFGLDPNEEWPDTLARLLDSGLPGAIAALPAEFHRALSDELGTHLGLKSDTKEAVSLRTAVKSEAKDLKEMNSLMSDGGGKPKRDSAADQLAVIVDGLELIMDQLEEPFAVVESNGVQAIIPATGSVMKAWLTRRLYLENDAVASETAMATAMRMVDSRARFDGQQQDVHLRVHQDADGVCWYDLANSKWAVVRITSIGWSIVQPSPVLFKRYRKTLHQVTPVSGGDIELLRAYVNCGSDDDWRILVAWLIAAFIPGTSRAVLALGGEQGSAKSTVSKMLRKLIDPSKVELLPPPKDESQLAQSAFHGWLLGFDNISYIQHWFSDALCRIVTGDAFETRRLYTNDEDVIWEFRRPVIINGIGSIISKPDLLNRSLIVRLSPIPADQRLAEADLWRDFENDRPRLFGACLTIVAKVLAELPSIKAAPDMRLADFSRIGVAVERALDWPEGAFAAAVARNSEMQVEEALEGSPVAQAVLGLMESRDHWSGTATELLCVLFEEWDSHGGKKPRDPARLGSELSRLAPVLRAVGIDATKSRGPAPGRLRTITLQKTEEDADLLSTTVHCPSAQLNEGLETDLNPLANKALDPSDEPFEGGALDGQYEGETVHGAVPTDVLDGQWTAMDSLDSTLPSDSQGDDEEVEL